ncbi:flagellar basal-body rod protein FlgG [Pseudochelatococcus contaminans]|uniref:Flagellar basal-body rod protein FlgG n=1 Tax=Pseudochelatococcus contaminans TaxID=1538103 RepID=A0A7W6EE97_9HYPH|nr:flagellar basal-body rod protein FlgG [Pseudochelatococcus contaminans]MBB3808025.1 flagellar basal-body rod protein FlgG [Pseudochelatococcus contaminans]
MSILAIAATGAEAQQTNIEVIANNIANLNTTGFKRSRAEFSDLLYQQLRVPGVPNQTQDGTVPEGARLGVGTQVTAIRNLHKQGSLTQTGNDFDVAITGRGWFRIVGPNDEILYTRAGAFNKNEDGQIVTLDGFEVADGLVIPEGTIRVTINEAGQVYALVDNAGNQEQQEVGQITMATFANDVGLEPLGNNLFRETLSSGAPVEGVAGDAGFGTIKQNYLEASNVDPVKEITELISAQRAYEMNSKVIQAGDEILATISKGIR